MNSIISIFNRIRLWGIKGIWDYLVRQFANAKTRRFFIANAKNYPMTPQNGITIIADMTKQSSLSKVMRDLAFALKQSSVPFQTFDLHPEASIPDSDVNGILTPVKDFRILKYTHVFEMFSSPLPNSLPLKRMRIIFWEFTTGLMEYNPAIADVKTVIAMSDFNSSVFRNTLPEHVAVKKILYPFFFETDHIPQKEVIRKKYAIPQGAFAVFFNFDYGSSFNRKNPDGAIKAFAEAFRNTPDTYLVFKTKGAAQHQTERTRLLQLSAELEIRDRVIMIDNYIPQQDIYGLTNACDVYISLHRGEGFGLGIAEAMSLGKPVIVTDYSSTTEFCKQENSIPIPCQLVKVPDDMHDHPCYHAVKEWAEPDLHAAAVALSNLYNDTDLRSKIGNSGKKFITDYFSNENFKNSVTALFTNL